MDLTHRRSEEYSLIPSSNEFIFCDTTMTRNNMFTLHKKTIFLILFLISFAHSFLSYPVSRHGRSLLMATGTEDDLTVQKKRLLGLLQTEETEDPVFADPITKQNIKISTKGTLIGGEPGRVGKMRYNLSSTNNTFTGSSDSFLNLLEPSKKPEETTEDTKARDSIVQNLMMLVPPPLRSVMATAGLPVGDEYIPMRDLFTSPAVSYAYERGWRQGFARAGFPGPEKEAEMAMEYFSPSMARSSDKVLVDMSCATGLFTRRFAKSGKYRRVIGCDYSQSMLEEARRRIIADPELKNLKNTRLDLVRCDVGQIPMKDNAIDALHAGAAMHCWPDLPAAVSEIYRVLKPGGRYFATTFLSSYFGNLQRAEGGANGPSRQAFQYFESVEQLRLLLEQGGFDRKKIIIEVLGFACVVIRAEK